jgi:ATP-dependent RNA helicase DHX29
LQFDEPLAASSNAPAPVLDANLDTPPPKSAPTDRPAISTNDPVPVSLFQSAALSDESDSSSDAGDIDAEADVCSRKWADLMLKLDSLRLAAGGGSKAKGNKKKGTGVVLETPEMREVMAKMKVIEKEYMFNRKDAGQYPHTSPKGVWLKCRRHVQEPKSQAGRGSDRGQVALQGGRAFPQAV